MAARSPLLTWHPREVAPTASPDPQLASHRPVPADPERAENLALLLAAAAAVVGAVIGLIRLQGTRPLTGTGSIGETASYAAMGTAGIAFLIAARLITLPMHPWLRRLGWRRRLSNLLGLAVLHAMFAYLLTAVLFAVFATAFRGVALDPVAGTFWVAVACGIAVYVVVGSASALTTSSLSGLLMVFMVGGVLGSAMSAPDPHWWRHHFSWLGAEAGGSGLAFNLTLLLAGFTLVTIGDFLAHDLDIWAAHTGAERWRVRTVRGAMILLGLLLLAVALIPVDVSKTWHDMAAQGIVVVFAAAIVGFPLLFPRLSEGFRAATLVIVAALLVCVVLWKGIGYLNTTAFEMGSAAIVFTWLLLFVRSVTAAVGSLEQRGGADGTGAAGRADRT